MKINKKLVSAQNFENLKLQAVSNEIALFKYSEKICSCFLQAWRSASIYKDQGGGKEGRKIALVLLKICAISLVTGPQWPALSCLQLQSKAELKRSFEMQFAVLI